MSRFGVTNVGTFPQQFFGSVSSAQTSTSIASNMFTYNAEYRPGSTLWQRHYETTVVIWRLDI